MAISINWWTGVIFVPRADMILIQSTPTEIRQLDVNSFRLALKDLEDDEGIPFPRTHNHNPPTTVSGATLARVVEILDPYTITFEDGQYAVNLVGANTNVGDKVNVNQVSVRSNNSTGLQDLNSLQAASFGDGAVALKSGSPYSGTDFPIGTRAYPVNNPGDAKTISTLRGLGKIIVLGDYTFLSTDDISFLDVYGEDTSRSTFTFISGCNTMGTEFYNCTIQGELDSPSGFKKCHFKNVHFISTNLSSGEISIENCLFDGTVTMDPSIIGELNAINCYSGVPGSGTPAWDFNGSQISVLARNYAGGMEIRNYTFAGGEISVDMNSGHIVVDSSCTQGLMILRGISKLTNNSGGLVVDSQYLVNPSTIADSVWEESSSDHENPNTMGRRLKQLIAKANAILGNL